jgi:hypothetical protein
LKSIASCLAIVTTALLLPVTASAAAPTAATGAAKSVTATSATLTGTLNPNGQATTYRFEYGPTATYGSTTPDQGPTAASKGNMAVSAGVGSLTPGATYHFRLVVTNPAGVKPGRDKTFTTSAGISLAAAPRTITFGRQTVLSGQLTSAKPGGVKITLEQDPAPFNVSEFKNVTTATTDATGKFTFSQAPTTNTAYRVTAKNPDASSSTVTVRVRMRVTLTVSTTRPKRGKTVTFSGSVAPQHNGQLVRIQKRVGKRWRTVTSTVLAASTDPQVSKFRKRVRIRANGVYRAFVAGDVSNAAGASRRKVIRVH